MDETIETLVELVLPLLLLAITFATGRWVEKRHYRKIRRREAELRQLPAVSFRTVPKGWEVEEAGLVAGNVVISVDHFKRFLAGLRQLFGGRVKSYESLMDRARREALLRCKEAARELGFHAVMNVRIETSRLASSTRKGQGTAGVEVMAFGTGLRLRRGVA